MRRKIVITAIYRGIEGMKMLCVSNPMLKDSEAFYATLKTVLRKVRDGSR